MIDADGLNALAGQTELLAGCTHPVILTPHPGEFARLIGKAVAAVQEDRVRHAAELAAISEELIVVLKGSGTVVTDGETVFRQHHRQPRDGDRRHRATSSRA